MISVLSTFYRQNVWYLTTQISISRYKASIVTKGKDTKTYLERLGGTLRFLILIGLVVIINIDHSIQRYGIMRF